VSGPLELWPVERIAFGLPRTPKRLVLAAMLDVAVKGRRLPAERRERLLELLLAREKSGSTASGGIAIPHVKTADVKSPLAALGVFPDGIEFDAVDAGRVHVAFLLISPDSMAADHVAVLRWIAGMARKPDFMPFVRRSRTPSDARALLEEMGA
jgi:mannitol/fructose-specific phosphotransferase system IIA component (Ntr-type)